MNTIMTTQRSEACETPSYLPSSIQQRLVYNHNQTLVRAPRSRGLNYNHNETLIRS